MDNGFDNERRGALFKNDRKRDGKQDPDYRGQCQIGGVEYWVSAWINTSKKDGSKFMGLTFQPKQDEKAPVQQQATAPEQPEFNDDIPF